MKYWIIPCNIKSYDVFGAFKKFNSIDWKQSKNLKSAEPDDIVLIYLSLPHQFIKYICKIEEVNKPFITIDDNEFSINGKNYINYGNYMQLKLLYEVKDDDLSIDILKAHGLKGNIQGPSSLKEDLLEYVATYIDRVKETSNDKDIKELESSVYKEGKLVQKFGTKFERNKKLREKAIIIHGTSCKACGFNFEKVYGEIGKDFIEVHHIKPMFKIREEIIVNPETDLVPLCSNCHRIIHRRAKEPLSVEDLKLLLK